VFPSSSMVAHWRGTCHTERVVKRDLHEDDEERFEAEEVPATAVCVYCMSAECMGCSVADELQSGIVQIIPWEREGNVWSRLWSTSYLSTLEAASFFGRLPDGPASPALRFAFSAELLSAGAMALFGMLAICAVAPTVMLPMLRDPAGRAWIIKLLIVGVPALATLLVGAHAAHGVWIDKGACKVGASSNRSRALRFGLYACGWDVLLGPLGFLVLLVKHGPKAATALFGTGAGLPTRATEAFLGGHYRLRGEAMRGAVRTSYVGAALATGVLALLLLGTMAALLFVS
jgi:hypothetical protein